MAATARIARVVGATSPAQSAARGTSRAGGGVTVRLAGVSAQSLSTLAVVRLAEVSAATGQSAATVRIADLAAMAPVATYVWDGQEWVELAPPGVALSEGTGKSSAHAGATSGAGTVGSAASGRSAVTALVAFTGTLTLSGGGVLSPSGAQTGPSDFVGTLNLTGGGTLSLSGSALQGPPGAGSLTVIPDTVNSPPRVLLELTGALGTQVTINRVDQAGNQAPVRLANPGALSAGTLIVYDYEAPYNTQVTYVATTSGPTITSDPVTLAVAQPWLVHPGIPDLSMPILVANVGDRTRDTNAGVHRPLGRADAIVITDGQRWSPTFNLAVGISTVEEERAIETLVDDASPLLLQVVYPDSRRSIYEWVAVGTITESDLLGYFGSEYQTWTLPCTVTSAPSGLLQAQRTLGDITAEWSTLGDIETNYATLRDVTIDNTLVAV